MNTILPVRGNYFNGNFHLPSTTGLDSSDTLVKRSCPANTEQKLWSFYIDYRHVDNITESLGQGFKLWRNKKIHDRANYVKKYQEIVAQKKNEIARAISLETGRPLLETIKEIDDLIEETDFIIENTIQKTKSKNYGIVDNDKHGYIRYCPIGPVLIVSSFVLPCLLPNRQIITSIMAGNSIVLKPSEKCCLSAQLLIECFHEAEFPAGVINLIYGEGDGEAVHRLIKDKSIKGIFFTGTREVGNKIIGSAHTDLTKLVVLNMSSKNYCIIDQNINMDKLIPELLTASFLSAGQLCTSTSIVAIHENISEELISKFHDFAKNIIIDHPIDYEHVPSMGPLIDQVSVDNYLLFMGMAKREGIKEIMRGKQLERKFKGYYVCPSIHFSQSFNPKSLFFRSEIFGPNCTFISYREIEEAVAIVNSSKYGLISSVYSNNSNIHDYCLENINTGIININLPTTTNSIRLPFGGTKQSGNYRASGSSLIDSCVYTLSGLKSSEDEKLSSNRKSLS